MFVNETTRRRIDRVCLIEVIRIDVTRGEGTGEDPVRPEIEFWTIDGVKIGTVLPPEQSIFSHLRGSVERASSYVN